MTDKILNKLYPGKENRKKRHDIKHSGWFRLVQDLGIVGAGVIGYAIVAIPCHIIVAFL